MYTVDSREPIDPRAALPDGPHFDAYAKRLVERALSNVLLEPAALDMGLWMYQAETACGTVACFAGHLVMAAGFFPLREGGVDTEGVAWGDTVLAWSDLPSALRARLEAGGGHRDAYSVESLAKALLQIDTPSAEALFYDYNWPMPIGSAQSLLNRVRAFAETGE